MGTWLALAAFLAASFAAAALSMGDAAAYGELTKPSWAPRAWLFGPVWTVLYIMMAVAGWMLWRQGAAVLLLPYLLWVSFAAALNIALWSANPPFR